MRIQLLVVGLFFGFGAFALPGAPPLSKLASYNIDPTGVSISGTSSGAFMAVQMQVAYSKLFSGAASVAGGIFWCAQGDSAKAQSQCMGRPQDIKTSAHIERAKELARLGSIDPLDNLKSHRVYIYTSPKDSIVLPGNSEKLLEFYQAFMSSSQITVENSVQSAHGFPTVANGNACGTAMLPWILKCNYDTAGEILKNMYGPLAPRGSSVATNLIKFDQSEFGNATTPLFASGWVYVPSSCSAGKKCRLHVGLHGCQMNPTWIQDKFETLTGYNEWAESNDIIVLYPQSTQISGNPYACWDWFGFKNQDYVTQSGPQMIALKKMIDRLSGK